MKRWIAFLLVMLMIAGKTFAQDNQPIVLNDATPGIDLAITLAPGAAGALSLRLSGAAVTVKDSTGKQIFMTTDQRVHALELHFAPGVSAPTVTLERMPGVQEAYVSIVSQSDLTTPVGTTLTSNSALTLGQEFDAPLSASSPSATLSISIPAQTQGNLTATFPGSLTTAQVLDNTGSPVATLDASQIDGLSLTLDGGEYQLSLLNTQPSAPTVAGISITSAQIAHLPAAVMATTVPSASVASATQPDCTIQINQSSINLRSGPGTGYSILGYAHRADNFLVGGTNVENSWLLVANSDGSGTWMSKELGVLNGNCAQLTIYDIPYREAQPPQIVVQNQPNSSAPAANSNFGNSSSHDHEKEDNHGSNDRDDDD